MTFNRNPTFTLQIHVIQGLILHVPVRNGASNLQKSIRQGAFPMVNMGDDTKVSNVLHTAKIGDFSLNQIRFVNQNKLWGIQEGYLVAICQDLTIN